MTLNDDKINLPRIVTINLKDKIKIACMMNKEPLLFIVILKQGSMWFILASSNKETVYDNKDTFLGFLCPKARMQFPSKILLMLTARRNHRCRC